MGIDVVFGNKYCQKPMKKGNSSAFNVIKLVAIFLWLDSIAGV